MATLGHVHLPVSDLPRSRSFYTETMGFEVGYEDDAMVSFPQVGLIIDQSDRVMDTGTIVGLSCQDADAEYGRLRQRGAPLGAPPQDQPWGVRNFYVSDPDGHQVEFEQTLSS
jgi:catechol 2,3-dioxygenase-like lactoylglutathione lyase family enzyme